MTQDFGRFAVTATDNFYGGAHNNVPLVLLEISEWDGIIEVGRNRVYCFPKFVKYLFDYGDEEVIEHLYALPENALVKIQLQMSWQRVSSATLDEISEKLKNKE